MRRSFILGIIIAAVAAAAVSYVGASLRPVLFDFAKGTPRIEPGFIGIADFGKWRLICVPAPNMMEGLGPLAQAGASPAPAKAANANSCRINGEMAPPEAGSNANAAPVIFAANFSLVGPKRMPAAMLRVPATARAGDAISLRFEDQTAITTIVRECAAECLAAGDLTGADWTHLSTAKSLQVTFPAAGGQRVLLDLPVQGLAEAVRALDRAEIPAAR
jgi:Invasion associated locus B (IalB) protein